MLCLTDLEGVMVVEEAWALDFGEALRHGPMLVGEEEDCRGVGTFSVEQRVCLGRGQRYRLKPTGKRPIPLTERQPLLLEQRPSLLR